MNVMVNDLNDIVEEECRSIYAYAQNLEMLLYRFLNELIYFKSAQKVMLRVLKIRIEDRTDHFKLIVNAAGEKIDPVRHGLKADVKAVTLSKLKVRKEDHVWRCTVVLDT